MAEVRYKVVGGFTVAGVAPGGILKVDDEQVNDYGQTRVTDPDSGLWMNVQAAVAGGILEPQSAAARKLAAQAIPEATTHPAGANG